MGILGDFASLFGGQEATEYGVRGQEYKREALEKLQEQAGNQVQVDPATRAAQTQALENLAGIGAAGGMDVQAKAAQRQAQEMSDTQAAAQRERVLQHAAETGTLGGGQSAALEMEAGQNAANRSSATGTQAASDARTRALQAMAASGQLAGNVRNEDTAAQEAANQINEFNARQRLMKGEEMANTYPEEYGQRQKGVGTKVAAVTGLGSDFGGGMFNGGGGGGSSGGGLGGALGGLMGGGGGSGGSPGPGDMMMAEAHGGQIPGQARYPHRDTLKNDTVPIAATPGEVVVPLSTVEMPEPQRMQKIREMFRKIPSKKGARNG